MVDPGIVDQQVEPVLCAHDPRDLLHDLREGRIVRGVQGQHVKVIVGLCEVIQVCGP